MKTMKFGVMFANAGPFAYPEGLENLARTAEDVGIESIWTVEHVVVPVDYRSKYPYSETGKMPGPETVPIADPIAPLAFAAAVTKKLRLATGVVILPQRHPLYVAKEMATLDVLSNGRAILGVGIGWLQEEFAAVGVPFKQRASRTEESIRAIRSLWKSSPEPFTGRFYKWGPVESHPKPVQQPGVPIVVGGHAEAAARRAARLGDGFFPARGELDSLAHLLTILREECAAVGRKPEAVEVTCGIGSNNATSASGGMTPDTVRRYQDLGVARLIIAPPAFDADGVRRGLHDFADRVIARL
jgi:probable F420-dependent oxidoreductase